MATKSEFLSLISKCTDNEVAPDTIKDSDFLEDVGVDSLKSVTLLLDIESTLGVSIPDELLTAESFATVGSLWNTIETVKAKSAATSN
jgi:acyl carrier protein